MNWKYSHITPSGGHLYEHIKEDRIVVIYSNHCIFYMNRHLNIPSATELYSRMLPFMYSKSIRRNVTLRR